MSFRLSLCILNLLCLTVISVFSQSNSKLSNEFINHKADSLVQLMTLDEKLDQLQVMFTSNLNLLKKKPIGTFFNAFNWGDPGNMSQLYNEAQQWYRDSTRLGIPVLHSAEGIMAFMGYGSTGFPAPISQAATWDTALVYNVALALNKELGSRGIKQVYAPVINIARDPRWGRTGETYGEDPYLNSRMGVAYVKAMEQNGIIATPKHFAANMGLDGKFAAPVHFSERLLREIYFPAFKACFQEGGAKSVMMAYNTLDGTACCAHSWLMNTIIKKEWGFDGFIVSDGDAMEYIYTDYKFGDRKQIAAQCMNAGCDLDLSNLMYYGEPLKHAIAEGMVSLAVLDESVKRVLRQKYRVGLFEQPFADTASARRLNNSPEHRSLAYQAALEGTVLLKNQNNTLPFSPEVRSVLVLGPLSDWILGNHYAGFGRPEVTVHKGLIDRLPNTSITYEQAVGMQSVSLPIIYGAFFTDVTGKKANFGLTGEYFANDKLEGKPIFTRKDKTINFDWKENSPERLPYDHFSVRWTGYIKAPRTAKCHFGCMVDDGMRLYINDKTLIDQWNGGARRLCANDYYFEKDSVYKITLEYFDNTANAYIALGWDLDIQSGIDEAVRLTKQNDVTIIVAGMRDDENLDRYTLDLDDAQEALILAVAATGKPFVVVLQTSNVITMANWEKNTPAIVEAWHPGEEGGHAIADILFGMANPSGKLPITIPQSTGQIPLNYNHYPNRSNVEFAGIGNQPLFPFGHGLSYTQFEYANLKLKDEKIEAGQSFEIELTVTNTGPLVGDEIVQLYLHDEIASVARPVKQLCAFQRVHLDKGETKTVHFKVMASQMKMLNFEMKEVIEPGDFKIMVGSSSDDIRLKKIVTVR